MKLIIAFIISILYFFVKSTEDNNKNHNLEDSHIF